LRENNAGFTVVPENGTTGGESSTSVYQHAMSSHTPFKKLKVHWTNSSILAVIYAIYTNYK